MKLTPHFTLKEMTTTATGLPNKPSAGKRYAMRALCSAILEPLREHTGALKINSGYRSPEVNKAIGGASSSQHLRGEAADIVALNIPRAEAWAFLLEMVEAGFPVDQAIIYEGTNHIHLSHTHRHSARRQLLVKVDGGNYVNWEGYTGPLK